MNLANTSTQWLGLLEGYPLRAEVGGHTEGDWHRHLAKREGPYNLGRTKHRRQLWCATLKRDNSGSLIWISMLCQNKSSRPIIVVLSSISRDLEVSILDFRQADL
jgi:hypothetical protein